MAYWDMENRFLHYSINRQLPGEKYCTRDKRTPSQWKEETRIKAKGVVVICF